MYGAGQQGGGWGGNPFSQTNAGFNVPPTQSNNSPPMYQTAPMMKSQNDIKSLDELDAFASQGFKKPQTQEPIKFGNNAMLQPSYSNVPLSKIPSKPVQNVSKVEPMQPPPPLLQNLQQSNSMYNHPTNSMPYQQVGMPFGQNMMPQSQTMYGMNVGQYNTNPFEQQQQISYTNVNQNMPPPMLHQGQQGYSMPAYKTTPNMNQGQFTLAQHQMQSPFDMQSQIQGQVQQGNHYNTSPMVNPMQQVQTNGPNQQMAQMRGMQSMGNFGNQPQWNPFENNNQNGGMTNNQNQPFQHNQQTAINNSKWDPFDKTDGTFNNTANAQGNNNMADEGWGDLTNDDIWGDQKAAPQSKATASSNASDDNAAWSDDEGGVSDTEEPSINRKEQEETDFQIAMRLQREEEEKASGSNVRSTIGAHGDASAKSSKADGECLARISKRTLLVKAWKPTYYIFELPDLLLLYRCRDDRYYNPKGTMIKKRIEIKHNHTLSPLTRKFYKDYGYLWHFTMEEQLDYGPSVLAKFALQDKRPLEELGNHIAEAIREKRRTRARLNNYSGFVSRASNVSPPPSYIYNASGGSPSAIRNAGNSDRFSKWGNIS